MFGNIGFPELLIIMAVALLIFGPKKLPEVGRSIGKAVREFRRTSDELRGRIEEEIHASEYKEIKEGLKRDIQEIETEGPSPPAGPPETKEEPQEPKKESPAPEENSPYLDTRETKEEPKKESPTDEEGQKVT
jgi:TatA/E family protein of Tat protein translocase